MTTNKALRIISPYGDTVLIRVYDYWLYNIQRLKNYLDPNYKVNEDDCLYTSLTATELAAMLRDGLKATDLIPHTTIQVSDMARMISPDMNPIVVFVKLEESEKQYNDFRTEHEEDLNKRNSEFEETYRKMLQEYKDKLKKQ
jgi:hypothetical protein